MLIESRSQKTNNDEKSTDKDNDKKDESMEVDTELSDKIKAESNDVVMAEIVDEEKQKSELPEKKNDDELNSDDVSVVDDKDSSENEKPINIDPRTYCKLGHFHLLLEDYAKGASLIKIKEISLNTLLLLRFFYLEISSLMDFV